MTRPTLLVTFGDMHIGSSVALCPPKVELDDGGHYYASKAQRWIWSRWQEFWTEARAWQERHDAEVVSLNLGEILDDLKHPSTQLWSRNKNDLARAGLEALEACRDISDRIYVVRGSEAHVGLSGALDESMARAIGATPDEEGHYARWQFMGVINGLRVDAAHHPGTGAQRPWTKGADANRLAQMVMAGYVEREMPVPHLILRGHNHRATDSADNHPARAVIMAAWQLRNAYVYRIGGDWLPIGGMLTVIQDGRIIAERKVFSQWPVGPWRKA